MRLVFCFAGKTQRGPVREILEDYITRIKRYVQVEVIEAKQPRLQKRPGIHISLDPSGDLMRSEDLARLLDKAMNEATPNVFFYTGDADGLSREVSHGAQLCLSLSPMTFNHQIVRIMLLEQVYRALTIIRSEPYHR